MLTGNDHVLDSQERRDFFISYTSNDQKWAEWIATQLGAVGYTFFIQAWDFRPGSNFVAEMNKALLHSERTLIVLSSAYLASDYAFAEWAAAFRKDPKGKDGRILPVRIQKCEIDGLLGSIVYIDLVDLDDKCAREQLLAGVQPGRVKTNNVPFPDALPHNLLTRDKAVIETNDQPMRPLVDVCIVCALAEEALAFLNVVEEHWHISWTKQIDPRYRYNYRLASIPNEKGEPLNIHVSWLSRYGSQEMVLHLGHVIEEYQPRLAAMTGICAGDKRSVKLGDLVVAERTFTYDTGKIVLDEQGQTVHQPDTITYQICDKTLQFLRLFDQWNPRVAALVRPFSKQQQRDWLLERLATEATGSVKDISLVDREEYAPAWRQLIYEFQHGPEPFLSPTRVLRDSAMIEHLRDGLIPFPFQDPPKARCHVSPLASGSAVRSDDPFEDIQIPVRGAVAIDMEGAAFGRVMQHFSAIEWLIVKGVSDYANQDKDDSYHTYAATVSATYMLCFIEAYVTQERFPASHWRQHSNRDKLMLIEDASSSRNPVSGECEETLKPLDGTSTLAKEPMRNPSVQKQLRMEHATTISEQKPLKDLLSRFVHVPPNIVFRPQRYPSGYTAKNRRILYRIFIIFVSFLIIFYLFYFIFQKNSIQYSSLTSGEIQDQNLLVEFMDVVSPSFVIPNDPNRYTVSNTPPTSISAVLLPKNTTSYYNIIIAVQNLRFGGVDILIDGVALKLRHIPITPRPLRVWTPGVSTTYNAYSYPITYRGQFLDQLSDQLLYANPHQNIILQPAKGNHTGESNQISIQVMSTVTAYIQFQIQVFYQIADAAKIYTLTLPQTFQVVFSDISNWQMYTLQNGLFLKKHESIMSASSYHI
jgi:nucleoside phosphorylase